MAEPTPHGDSSSAADTLPTVAGDRGTLTYKDRVGVKIAETAALEVDGVIARSGQGLLGGRGTPHALAEMHEPATFSISIAVLWPSPITKVCNDVRAHVTGRVQELTGITPTRVDVDVAELVARSSLRSHSGPE